MGLEDGLQLVVVELGVRVGDAHEEPGEAGVLVALDLLQEETPPERAVGGDPCPGRHHDDGRVFVFGQQQNLAGGSCTGQQNRGQIMVSAVQKWLFWVASEHERVAC